MANIYYRLVNDTDANITGSAGFVNGKLCIASDTHRLIYKTGNVVYRAVASASETLGDTLYASAANTLSLLAGNTTTTRKFLRQTGTGTASAAPVWDTLLAADIPDLSATYQPLDADLTAIAALSATGVLSRTAANTWATASGTANYLTKWNAGGTGIANSQVFDDATTVSINATSPRNTGRLWLYDDRSGVNSRQLFGFENSYQGETRAGYTSYVAVGATGSYLQTWHSFGEANRNWNSLATQSQGFIVDAAIEYSDAFTTITTPTNFGGWKWVVYSSAYTERMKLSAAGALTIGSIAALGSSGTTFLTHTAGLIQSRTAAETFSDCLTASAGDLTAIEAISGTGILSRTAANTWATASGTANTVIMWGAAGLTAVNSIISQTTTTNIVITDTNTLTFVPNYAGLGDVPAGVLITSGAAGIAHSLRAGSVNSTAGSIGAYVYNGTAYKSAWEVANVASGLNHLQLMKTVGLVSVGAGVTAHAWSSSFQAMQFGGNGALFWDITAGASKQFDMCQNMYYDGAWKYQSTDEASQISQTGGRVVFYTVASGSANAATGAMSGFNAFDVGTTAIIGNESGRDIDYRYEGSGASGVNLFTIDAGALTVNIGGSVEGSIATFGASSIALKQAVTFSSTARYATSTGRRYFHIPLDSGNPGASGATWVNAGANTTGGWQINASSEILHGEADIHADWDGATDLKYEVKFMVNVNNTGGGAGDTVDLRLNVYYKGTGDVVTKTQAVENAVVVGASAQYKQFTTTFTIDWDAASNVVEVGDVISFVLNLETDTSEVDDVVIVQTVFYYQTTHIGIESGDV